MSPIQFDGWFDTLHHNPSEHMIFWTMDIGTKLMTFLDNFTPHTLYVHDAKRTNGAAPGNAFDKAKDALDALSLVDPIQLTERLLKWPNGAPGNPYATGGCWTCGRASFYIVRAKQNDSNWELHLCANIY